MIQHFLPLLPELLVIVAGAFLALRGGLPVELRRWAPLVAAVVILAALALELWLGAALVNFAAYTQDRFALFGKAALLLGLLLLVLISGWEGERGQDALPMACGVALAGMVAVSATSLPLLWVAVVAAALAGTIAVSPRLPDRVQLRIVAATAVLAGLGFTLLGVELRAVTFTGLQQAAAGAFGPGLSVTAMLAVSGVMAPLVLLPVRAWTADEEPAVQEAILGSLVTATSVLAAAKLLGALFADGSGWGPYVAVLAAFGAAACGLAALAAGSLRGLVAWLVTAQAAWTVAALAAHDRMGSASAVYLLGGLVLAAAAAPLLAAGLRGPRSAVTGLAHRQPWRWLGLSLALLSLAGAPPLAGFFGEFAVALELLRAQLAWVLAAGLLGSALSLWAVVRVIALAWLEPDSDERRLPAQGWQLTAVLAAVLVLAYGLFAYPIHGLAVQSAEALGLFR